MIWKNKHANGEQLTDLQLLQINSPEEQDGYKQQFKIWKRNQANQTEENGILKKDKKASILTGRRLTARHRDFECWFKGAYLELVS